MDKEVLGKFICSTRRELGLTQQTLADKLHVTDKAVSKWERGISYPDVTLLEDLAAALQLSTTELLNCRRNPTPVNEDEVSSLLDIARESNRKLKKKYWLLSLLVIGLVLIAGVVLLHDYRPITTQEYTAIWGKQVKSDGYVVYLEKDERLLVLTCPNRELYDAIIADGKTTHSVVYRWNPHTYRGTLEECESVPGVDVGSKVTDMAGSSSGVGELFGIECMLRSYRNVYPNPEGDYLFVLDYYYINDGKDYYLGVTQPEKWVLTVKDCRDVAYVDYDTDGITELLVLTRYEEAPYRLYDLVDGRIVSKFIDEIPESLEACFVFSDIRAQRAE